MIAQAGRPAATAIAPKEAPTAMIATLSAPMSRSRARSVVRFTVRMVRIMNAVIRSSNRTDSRWSEHAPVSAQLARGHHRRRPAPGTGTGRHLPDRTGPTGRHRQSTLSQLEAGTGNPSVETVWALGVALDVPFSRLVEAHPAVRVIRAGNGTGSAPSRPTHRHRSPPRRGGLPARTRTGRHVTPPRTSPAASKHLVVGAVGCVPADLRWNSARRLRHFPATCRTSTRR